MRGFLGCIKSAMKRSAHEPVGQRSPFASSIRRTLWAGERQERMGLRLALRAQCRLGERISEIEGAVKRKAASNQAFRA